MARHHRAKLHAWQVREIKERHALGESQSALAMAYGVSQPTVAQIVNGSTWRNVQPAGYVVFSKPRRRRPMTALRTARG